jgi:uncharacterized membrane protein
VAESETHRRFILRWLVGLVFLAAGIVHLLLPAPFVRVTPLPAAIAPAVVLATGLCEIAGSLALLCGGVRLRWWAGAMLALYALCVWPANVRHALLDLGGGTGLGWLYHLPRLAFQPVIIWWALYAGGVVRRSDRTQPRQAGPSRAT